MVEARALHFVLKISNRDKSIDFFVNILRMKILRHEEFTEGCEASCNGPYDGAWSKTMVGYGSEDNHFAIELTYNYGIDEYAHGNDFGGIHIRSNSIYDSIVSADYPFSITNEKTLEIVSPSGYKFFLHNENHQESCDIDPIFMCSLSSSNLEESEKYWHGILGMRIAKATSDYLLLNYGSDQCTLCFEKIDSKINHAKAYGRIAFSTEDSNLARIQEMALSNKYSILKPLVGLDTPGKVRVYVVIFADPDGHEICFVGDKAFRELSAFDPDAKGLLFKAIESDKSSEWFSKRGGKSKSD